MAPRISWITLATVLLTAGVLLTFGLEMRYIARSRPAPEAKAIITWVKGGRGPQPGSLVGPSGLAADSSGDIYVADLGNARVQRFSAGGAFLSLWPATAEGQPHLVEPSDVAVGDAGEVYVLDAAAGVIYRLRQGGNLTAVVPLAPFQPFSPRGLALDRVRGLFYVADTGRGRVLLIRRDGTLFNTWGGGGNGGLSFEQPRGLGLDRQGNLFVAETGNSRVRKISPDGVVLAQWKVKGSVSDLAVGPDDRVYVTAADRNRLWIYDSEGKPLGQVDAPLEKLSLGSALSVTVIGPGDVVIGAESSILRLSVQLKK
jgi:DNA-binding beta-propeller fold protein YncE